MEGGRWVKRRRGCCPEPGDPRWAISQSTAPAPGPLRPGFCAEPAPARHPLPSGRRHQASGTHGGGGQGPAGLPCPDPETRERGWPERAKSQAPGRRAWPLLLPVISHPGQAQQKPSRGPRAPTGKRAQTRCPRLEFESRAALAPGALGLNLHLQVGNTCLRVSSPDSAHSKKTKRGSDRPHLPNQATRI